MSTEKQTTIAKIKTAIADKKRKAEEDHAAMIERAHHEAAETIKNAQKEADVLIANSTFRNVFFVHNNIIHDVKPNGTITPFVPDSFEPGQGAKYKKALEAYSKAMASYKPWLTKIIKVKEIKWYRPNGKMVKKRVRYQNPVPPPRPPVIPQDKYKKLNAAVSDIIVDIPTQTMFWGRWAAPFQVFQMPMEGANKITTLYECTKPVTSVALGPKTSDPKKRHLYWMEGNELIKRGTIDGSMPQQTYLNITAPDRGGLWQIEVDAINNKIYWTNDISLWRADIVDNPHDAMSTSLMVISPSESSFPIDLAVDGYNGILYWIDKDLKKLRKSDLEGVVIEDMYDIYNPTRGLKVDPNANLLYWSDELEDGHALRRGDTKNQIIRLDGHDDFIEVQSFSPGSSFTIEMWVNPDKTDDNQCFIGKHTKVGGDLFLIGYYNGQFSVTMRDQIKGFSGTKRKGLFHLAVTVRKKTDTNSSVSVFVNGEKLETQEFSKIITNWGQQPWFIGKDMDPEGANDFFDGGINEVRVWSSVRTQNQIKSGRYTKLSGNENNLKGYWRADERHGDILPDLSGNGRFANIHREFHMQPDTSILNLDGKTNSISIPPFHYDLNGGLTFEVWAYYESFPNWSRILDFGNGPDKDSVLLANIGKTNEFGIWIKTGENGRNSTSLHKKNILELNEWAHLAVTVDPTGKAHIYKNGKLVASTPKDRPLNIPSDTIRSSNFIGKSNYQNVDGLFHGKLLDLRFWNRALTPQEIKSKMHQRLNGNEDRLLAYWPMNESNGVTIKDITGNGLDGSIFDPEGKLKEDLSLLKRQKKALDQNIAEMRKEIKGLEQLLANKKAYTDGIKAFTSNIAALASQIQAFNVTKAKSVKSLNKDKEELKKLAGERSKLNAQKNAIVVQQAPMKAQIAQLESINTFGFYTPIISILKSQVASLQAVIISLNTATNKIVNQQKKLNKQMSIKAKEIASIDTKIKMNADVVDSYKTQRYTYETHLVQINTAIGERKITTKRAAVKELKQEVKMITMEIETMSEQFFGNVEKLWMPESTPVNNTVEKVYEPHTIVGIPGLDGLELVHAEEYAKAKRKIAMEELHRVREKGAKDKARAQTQANAKVAEGERIKLKKQQEADAKEAAARAQTNAQRQEAARRKQVAEANARKSKAKAEKDKRDNISKANSDASRKKSEAQKGADKKVAAARNRKATASADANRAKSEKKRLIG